MKSERTRQFIIEAAAGIFNTKGYAATSLSDLTAATKLTKGSIYGNFANKEEVALAVFDYNFSCVSKKITHEIIQCNTNKDKLMVYGNFYKNAYKNGLPEGGCPLLNTAIEADDMNEPLRKRVSDIILQWKKNIVQIINKGIEANEFKKDTNADAVALSIIALIEGGMMIGKVTKNNSFFDIIMDQIQHIIHEIEIKKQSKTKFK
ncbi:MAG: TetR/AcrR family transcriptional regulator [Chitinophagales bacterium]